jgi:hypothetical protein
MTSLRTAAAAVVVGALALGAGPALAQAPLTTVHCGQTLTSSVRLANDLSNCSGPGLVVGADGITVDLNGHTIDGTVDTAPDCSLPPFGTPGIDTGGHNHLTIENGTVQHFLNGIAAGVFVGDSSTAGMADSSIVDVTARANGYDGIAIGGDVLSQRDRIERDVATGNLCAQGIEMVGYLDNSIDHDRSSNNGGAGIETNAVAGSLFEDDVVAHNGSEGIVVGFGSGREGFGSDNLIRRNVVGSNGDVGILVGGFETNARNVVTLNDVWGNGTGIQLEGSANRAIANHVGGNHDDIFVFSDDNTVADNAVDDAVGGCDDCGYGIFVDGGSGNLIAHNAVRHTLLDGIEVVAFDPGSSTTGTVVRDNSVSDATRDGLAVATEGVGTVTGTTLERNAATGSGDDGFDVRSPATTLTSNLALRNHDFGIDAVAGVTDGGGNVARGNGHVPQCTGVACA